MGLSLTPALSRRTGEGERRLGLFEIKSRVVEGAGTNLKANLPSPQPSPRGEGGRRLESLNLETCSNQTKFSERIFAAGGENRDSSRRLLQRV
jgi:hypothetical protein